MLLTAKTKFFVNKDDTLPVNISNKMLIYGEEVRFSIVLVYF